MNIFGDPINFHHSELSDLLAPQLIKLEMLEERVIDVDAFLRRNQRDTLCGPSGWSPIQIKEITTLVKELFYEVTYVYYYIKRNLKPEDQSRIKKLVETRRAKYESKDL